MKHKKVISHVFFTLVLLLIPLLFGSPTKGVIQGKVTDRENGEPLPGANVIIDGTSLGAATDLKGNYTVLNAPVGEQLLRVTYIGYKSDSARVNVQPREKTVKNFELVYKVIEGQTVTVTAQAEGQIAAINQQLSSKTIVNVVSKTRIQELPDANAAESVGRLPGVSIVRDGGEGNKVVIRGLQPEMNLVTVNGVRMPSTEIVERSVDLSMVSSNMLDGIELKKALTPDQDADVIGGTIDLQVKKASEQDISLMVQKGYNGQQDNFRPLKGWLNYSDRYFNNKLGIMVSGNYELADRSSDRFRANYDVQGNPDPGEEFNEDIKVTSVRLSDRINTRMRYGGALMMDYKLENGQLMLNTIASRLDNETYTYQDGVDLGERIHDLRFIKDHYTVDFLSNAFSGEYLWYGHKLDFMASHAVSKRNNPINYYFSFREKAGIENDAPVFEGPGVIFDYTKNRLEETGLERSQIEPEKSTEMDFTVQFNVETPLFLSKNITGNIKWGGKVRRKDRDADVERYRNRFDIKKGEQIFDQLYEGVYTEFTMTDLPLMKYWLDPNYDAGDFLGGEYELSLVPDKDKVEQLYADLPRDEAYFYYPSGNLNDQDITEVISAGYIMSTLNFGKRLMILPGMRFEHEETKLLGIKTGFEESGAYTEVMYPAERRYANRSSDLWFPMLHMRYKFFDWLDLRMALTKSTIRPEFKYIQPYYYEKTNEDKLYRGSPDLEPATARNYDVSLSAYSGQTGLLTISGFYKEVDNMFYSWQRRMMNKQDAISEGLPETKAGWWVTDYQNNANTAYVRGFEVDLQTQLSFLPGLLNGLVLNANYAKISSNTRYNHSLMQTEKLPQPPWFQITRVDTSREGRMLRQSNDIANVAIGYDKGGFSGRLSLLFQGNTLSRIGRRPELDGFTGDYLRLDLSLKQDIGYGIKLFFNINNLTDEPDKSYEPVHSYLTDAEYYGMTADLGVRYTIF